MSFNSRSDTDYDSNTGRADSGTNYEPNSGWGADGKTQIKSHYVAILLVIAAGLLLFHFRHKLAEAHDRWRTRRRAASGFYERLGTFQDNIAAGFLSANFDLEANVAGGDTRKGLLEEALAEIQRIMDSKRKTFDEARLEYTQSELGRNGVDKDGVPLDPKLVTF